MEHTKLPWRYETGPAVDGKYHAVAGGFFGEFRICAVYGNSDEQDFVNAAYIVQACNAYPELVKALREAVDVLDSKALQGLYTLHMIHGGTWDGPVVDMLKLRKILADNEPKPPAPTSDDRSVGRTDSEIA